jgi:3-phytase
MPLVETEPVATRGDAADDPAIWVDEADPSQSLIIGTNKKRGLDVYRLDGTLHQSLPVGRMNNVDLRNGFDIAGQRVVLVAASDRDQNVIALFTLDPATRQMAQLPDSDVATGLTEIYGLCMYEDRDLGRTYVFVNDKDGRYQQHELSVTAGGRVVGRIVREFRLSSQPEGCAADDELSLVYVGEEGVGFYRMGADPTDPTGLVPVDTLASGRLVADVEGIAILARPGGGGYVVVSSQGDNSYAIYERQPPNAYVRSFRIGDNEQARIDGASETDGLEVTSATLPPPFSSGLLVVQDGANTRPRAAQNFKLVPWDEVERAIRH